MDFLNSGKKNMPSEQFSLTNDQRHLLHRVACELVAAAARQEPQSIDVQELGDLAERAVVGAFVTLRKDAHLRGCIGNFAASSPLASALERAAVGVVSHDPRFPSVTADELPQLTVELSLLHSRELLGATAPERIDNVVIGVHGLDIQFRGRSGLLLPRVPVDHGWDKIRFLEEVCRKANLADEAWQDPEAIIYRFCAIYFGGPFREFQ
jgi:AmmeMemoRadiSam system protein A